MQLRHLMMLRRIDQACARMNSGLSAIAMVLGLMTGLMAVLRFGAASDAGFMAMHSLFEAVLGPMAGGS